MFIWEGETTEELQFTDCLNDVGVMDTSPAFDSTIGWQKAFAKIIEGFRNSAHRRNRPRLEQAIDLCRRGMSTLTREAVRAEPIRLQE